LPEKRNPSISNPLYEVLILQEMEAHTWPDGNVSPAHEHMPGSWQWGSAGWSYSDLQSAWVKFQELTAGSVGAVAKMKTKRERTVPASAHRQEDPARLPGPHETAAPSGATGAADVAGGEGGGVMTQRPHPVAGPSMAPSLGATR
jgi:hypothetical protein